MSQQHNTNLGPRQRLRSVSLGTCLLLLALCSAVALTASLGAWQLRRADEKRDLLHKLSVNQSKSVSQDAGLLNGDKYRFRNLKLQGIFDVSHAVWQASQMHAHRLGYVMWMPFHVSGHLHAAQPWIWVNLGWVPQGPGRRPQMPAWQPSTLEMAHEGVVDLLVTSKVPWVGQQAVPTHWPVATVLPDWPMLNAHLHRRFYPLSWRLSAPAPKGWSRDHKWVVMLPARHLAYAVQWFALAFALVLCGLWFIYKKGK